MPREQQIVARDFLGLCNRDAHRIGGRDGCEGDEKEQQGVSPAAGRMPSPRLFHDTEFAPDRRPRLASNQNVLASFTNGSFSRQFTGNDTFSSLALRGCGRRPVANVVGCHGFGENLNPMVAAFTGVSSTAQKPWLQVGTASTTRDKIEDAYTGLDSDKREKVAITGKPLEFLNDADIQLLTREECRRYLKEKERRHLSWNKAAALQQLISLQNLQEERRLVKSRQGADWLATHTLLSPQVENGANLNQGNATCSQRSFNLDYMVVRDNGERGPIPSKASGSFGNYEVENQLMAHTLRFGVSSVGCIARVPEEHSSSSSPCHTGDVPKSSLCLSLSNSNEHPLSTSALRTKMGSVTVPVTNLASVPTSGLHVNLPVVAGAPVGVRTRPMASESPGSPANPQLTIFYSGSVNVYDDIPADKAQAIMLFAGRSNPWSAKVTSPSGVSCVPTTPFLTASLPSRPASPPPCPPPACCLNPPNALLSPQKLHLSMQIGQNSDGLQAAAVSSQASPCSVLGSKQLESSRPCTPSISSTLPACPPAGPRALPQARKASLARFLEKRKERVRSKQPYPLKKDESEYTFSQGEKLCPTSPCTGADDVCDEQKMGNALETDDRAESSLEGMATCHMDTEEQGWLRLGEKCRHGAELKTGVQVS